MATSISFSTTCPNCGIKNTYFSGGKIAQCKNNIYSAILHCGFTECRYPIMVIFTYKLSGSINECGYLDIKSPYVNYIDHFPKKVDKEAPKYLSENVKNLFLDAAKTHESGIYWLAVTAFRTVIETALKEYNTELNGKLGARISILKERGEITPSMAEWAHRIRIEGNSGTHDGADFSKEESEELMLFSEMLLTYLFTMPEKVRLAREKN